MWTWKGFSRVRSSKPTISTSPKGISSERTDSDPVLGMER
jgi:hypothetical protein